MRKVLLGLETTSHCHVQYSRIRGAQHRFSALNPLTQNELMRGLARGLAKHPPEMGRAQSYRLGHLVETQVVFHLHMDQLFNPSQARGAQSAFIDLHRTVPYCMTIDQRYGHRLFNRIQKQSPARKASSQLRMSRRDQRTQACVRELALCAQFYVAISSVRGGH